MFYEWLDYHLSISTAFMFLLCHHPDIKGLLSMKMTLNFYELFILVDGIRDLKLFLLKDSTTIRHCL